MKFYFLFVYEIILFVKELHKTVYRKISTEG